ncbi:unnamed protein product [Rhizophagus irregularis]|uniref:Uncharacterized protein n=1 Tax=Rhizophagus irregularis TaxID=588596 RepID=A0A915ZLU0_9GLOM|nr:unnamed protein product [Rhizophagus irregularis]
MRSNQTVKDISMFIIRLGDLKRCPNWTYMEQNMLADTDFSEPEMHIQMMENLIMAEDAEMSAEMDKIVVIEDSKPTGIEESEPMGVEESPEMEDETDKWYKFVL